MVRRTVGEVATAVAPLDGEFSVGTERRTVTAEPCRDIVITKNSREKAISRLMSVVSFQVPHIYGLIGIQKGAPSLAFNDTLAVSHDCDDSVHDAPCLLIKLGRTQFAQRSLTAQSRIPQAVRSLCSYRKTLENRNVVMCFATELFYN